MEYDFPCCVLVTGATGLLGTAVMEKLAGLTHPIPVSRGAPPDGLRGDLLEVETWERIRAADWDAAVHCAAIRSPERCEENRDVAYRLNVEAAARMAECAAARNAWMVHISTDYVFDGERPPYGEEDATAPVNFYGETKREAEQEVLSRCRTATVLRIPALYGDPPAPSPLLEEGMAAASAGTECFLDDTIVRYPTHTGDVADVVAFLLRRRFAGFVHASAQRAATRYEWARLIGEIMGWNTSHLRRSIGRPDRLVPRPRDTHLKVDRLRQLGGPVPRDCNERLIETLGKRFADGGTGGPFRKRRP